MYIYIYIYGLTTNWVSFVMCRLSTWLESSGLTLQQTNSSSLTVKGSWIDFSASKSSGHVQLIWVERSVVWSLHPQGVLDIPELEYFTKLVKKEFGEEFVHVATELRGGCDVHILVSMVFCNTSLVLSLSAVHSFYIELNYWIFRFVNCG